jgi:ribosomal subunit interface protein
MGLRISGKSVDIGQALRGHVEDRVASALARYFDGGFTGHVTIEREGSGFKTDCAIHLDTGIVLKADGFGQDAHQSFDQAADRIEKRLRRYKGRLKDHREKSGPAPLAATEFIIAATDEEADAASQSEPAIIAEQPTSLRTLSVSAAVMALDLAAAPCVVFRHAGHGGINVVYRRSDGNIGWIDPSQVTGKVDAKH